MLCARNEELWAEVHDTVQEAVIKTSPKKRNCKKSKWLSEEALEIASHLAVDAVSFRRLRLRLQTWTPIYCSLLALPYHTQYFKVPRSKHLEHIWVGKTLSLQEWMKLEKILGELKK